jgi:hypothetical protein
MIWEVGCPLVIDVTKTFWGNMQGLYTPILRVLLLLYQGNKVRALGVTARQCLAYSDLHHYAGYLNLQNNL